MSFAKSRPSSGSGFVCNVGFSLAVFVLVRVHRRVLVCDKGVGRSHTDSRFKLWIHIASLKTSNIPFAWFLVLGCNRQAQAVTYVFLFQLQDPVLWRRGKHPNTTKEHLRRSIRIKIPEEHVHGILNASSKICSLVVNGQSFLVTDGSLLNLF